MFANHIKYYVDIYIYIYINIYLIYLKFLAILSKYINLLNL